MGYLICEKCGGHYQLKKGESAADFERCECGGKLQYREENKNEYIESKSDFKDQIRNSGYSRMFPTGKSNSTLVFFILTTIFSFFAPFLMFPLFAGFFSVIKFSNTEFNKAFGAFAGLISYFLLLSVLSIINVLMGNQFFDLDINTFHIFLSLVFGAFGGFTAKEKSVSINLDNKELDSYSIGKYLDRTKKVMRVAGTLFVFNGAYFITILFVLTIPLSVESEMMSQISKENNETRELDEKYSESYESPSDSSDDSESQHNPNTYDYWYKLGKSEGIAGINHNPDVMGTKWEKAYLEGYEEGYPIYLQIHNAFNT